MNQREDKKWKVVFKKLPSGVIDDRMMPVIAPTEVEARRLSLLGIAFSNLKNKEVESIEIVSCIEIV